MLLVGRHLVAVCLQVRKGLNLSFALFSRQGFLNPPFPS